MTVSDDCPLLSFWLSQCADPEKAEVPTCPVKQRLARLEELARAVVETTPIFKPDCPCPLCQLARYFDEQEADHADA